MHKTIYLTVLLSFFGFLSLHGQLYYGGGVQYNVDASAPGLQGKLFFEIDDTWRGSGTFTLHFDNTLNWTIDLDGHYKLLDVTDRFNISPLAGLAIVDLNSGTSIGFNLGAFIDVVFGEKHVYFEPKFTIRSGTALVLSGGVFF